MTSKGVQICIYLSQGPKALPYYLTQKKSGYFQNKIEQERSDWLSCKWSSKSGGLPKFTGFKSYFLIRVFVDLQHVFNYIPQMRLHIVQKKLRIKSVFRWTTRGNGNQLTCEHN